MVWTTLGYHEVSNNPLLDDIDALKDSSVTNIGAKSILVPGFASKLAAVVALGGATTQARVVAPSLEAFNNVDVGGINQQDEPDSPTPMMQFFGNPIPLTVNEELGYQSAESLGPSGMNGILFLMDKIDPVATFNGVKLPVRTIRFTGSETLVPNTWTAVEPDAVQNLKAGRYQAVGLRTIVFGGVAARYDFTGEAVRHRPGCPAYDNLSDVENPIFRGGVLGVWGEFEHNQIPQIEVWSTQVATTQEFFMDLVKIR